MERLFNEYHLTGAIQKEINIERARIQKDNNLRLADIREIETTIQEIREQLKDLNIGAKKQNELFQESNDLQQDGIHKERERSEFLERRNGSLNEKMRKQMLVNFLGVLLLRNLIYLLIIQLFFKMEI